MSNFPHGVGGEGRIAFGEPRRRHIGISSESRRSTAGNLTGGGGWCSGVRGYAEGSALVCGRNNPSEPQGLKTRSPLKS